jgi:hypothetical protein
LLKRVVKSNLTAAGAEREDATGQFVAMAGERFYAIRNVDRMAPFFISVVSSDDHWLFVSSTGGLTAGRISPETALFPYVTDDKIHDNYANTGSKTILRVHAGEEPRYWEPFNREQDSIYTVSRNLYKNVLGNKLCFEEINHDLEVAFRYTWATSDDFGFVRFCELQNLGNRSLTADLIDGLQNILPAGTPASVQANASNLLNAYKWTELDESTGLAFLTLYSGITDRAEPYESLRATTAFSLGLEGHEVLLSSTHLNDFRRGKALKQERYRSGIRGAYLVSVTLELAAKAAKQWQIVADLEQSQGQVVALRHRLEQPNEVFEAVVRSVESGSDALARMMARADGFQITADETETVHHFANVLFNSMRGGTFLDQYSILARDFAATIKHFNKKVYQRNRELIEGLPERLRLDALLGIIVKQGDSQLERLAREYLPLTFARRHGDPSRPWNHFAIELKDEDGEDLLHFQGNWRDIFQNWEALTFSYPGFAESVIAKFVNASTMDGYNPYRIGKDGIDWEVEEPDDPWSYIGYWGDHQIIYLEKLLELSSSFNPNGLRELLRRPIFSYANVPYRIKPFAGLIENPKSTVIYDVTLAEKIEHRVAAMGADGKLMLDADGEVFQVNLLEKLLVPLLAKLGNLVIDGGIWLNTQRPEWNDANNALVGQGLSVVTLCYMRRYVAFLQELLADESESFALSGEVSAWLGDTAAALDHIRELLGNGPIDERQRYDTLAELGEASSHYRETVYQQGTFSGTVMQPVSQITKMLDDALAIIDSSILANRREDGLFHSYNLLDLRQDTVGVDHLYPMLEGQVAALSAGNSDPGQAVSILEALFHSDIYCPARGSFMLYPDRQLPGFLAKNRMSRERIATIPLLEKMLSAGDESIAYRDADGWCRFNPDIANADQLRAKLDQLLNVPAAELEAAHQPVHELYEEVFRHKEFTGRSGTMFGYEGLGSIYWHMVSKLLLAVQENFFAALESGVDTPECRRLGQLYYLVREGLGFNQTPADYGAFPTDPYSHSPKHGGASQPGMTGQVKEEVLSRFGELGVRVGDGSVRFQPNLLRALEFLPQARKFRYLDVEGHWQELSVPALGLAFTWCQVPIIYRLANDIEPGITIGWNDSEEQHVADLGLSPEVSAELFQRSGRIRQLTVTLGAAQLMTE